MVISPFKIHIYGAHFSSGALVQILEKLSNLAHNGCLQTESKSRSDTIEFSISAPFSVNLT